MPDHRNPIKQDPSTGRKAIPGNATASDSGSPSTTNKPKPGARRARPVTSRHLSLTDARGYEFSEALAARVAELAEDPLVQIGEHESDEFRAVVRAGITELETMFPDHRWGYKRKRGFVRDMVLDACHEGYSEMRREVDSSLDTTQLRPKDESPPVMFAAMMRRPAMIWLYLWLQLSARGRPGHRTLTVGSLLVTGLGRQHPHPTHGRKVLVPHLGRSAYDLALGFPVYKSEVAAEAEAEAHAGVELDDDHIVGETEGPSLNAMNKAIKRIFCRRDPKVLMHINAQAQQELRPYLDEGRADSQAKFGQICAIDAQIIDSELSPHRYRPMLPAKIAEVWGTLVGLAHYPDKKETRVGRKRVAIIDVPSRKPLVWTYIKITTPEYKAIEELMTQLFALWRTCPIEVLIGDGLYESTGAVHRF